MPTFLIELNDGRKFQVEANRQPTPEEAMSLIGGGQIAPSESKPYLSQLGEALSTGYGQMTSGVGATFNAITGDVPDVAENLAEMGRLQRKQQSSRSAEDIALAEDFARSKEAYEMSQGPLEAMEALGGYLGATARNPGAAFKQAVQSAPNALIGGATELAGYALGGLAGGAAGIETGPGAILTGIAGATAGGAISNSLMEAGPAIYDILNEKTGGAAANMTAGEITAYLNQNPDILSEGLKTGAIRGSVIGLVEGLGLKGAGALATIPERAAARAVQKTLVDAGVDVASKEAIETAVKNPTIFAAVKQAGETAKQQFSSAGNLARMAGAAGIEVGSSGVGELGAQVATGQPVNPTDIYQEMLGEAALSLPVAAAGKALEARKYILPSKVEEAMPPPPPEIEVASDALNATANIPFTDISGQAASDTIAQNTELAMRMPVQPVEEVEEVEEVAEDSADPEFLQKRWQSLEDSALAVIEAGAMDRLPAIRDEQARLAKRIARITAMKTPSPEMEKPEKPSQTITGSNVQTGTEMPVPDKSTVTSPGEAPLVTPEEKKSADNAEVELIEPTVENIKVPTPYVTGNGGQRGEIVAENGDRITVEWRDGTTTTVNKNEVIPRTAIQQIIKNKTEIAQTSTSNSDKFTVFYYDENGKMHHLGEFSGETEDARDRAFEKAFALAEENAREHNHADVHYGKKKFPVKKSTSKVSKTTESPLVTPEEESLAAQRRADLLSAAADAAKGKTKAQVSPVVTAMVTPQQPTPQENAVQEQITDEGVLRQERPEMELQGMGEQNVQPQETATEGQIQEEVIAAPGESEQGTLYGKPSKLTDKDRSQAVSLAKTLQPGDVVETNDGQETFRYKVVVEDGTRLLRKIDQRGDIIEGVREKFLANPARTSSQGELAAIPDGRDTIDVIARGRIIRSGTEAQPTIQVAVERDLTKPEQMTPEEYLTPRIAELEKEIVELEANEPKVSSNAYLYWQPKLMEAKRNLKALKEARDTPGTDKPWAPGLQQRFIFESLEVGEPVSAAAVDAYQITLPEGYVRQGDLYVFQPSSAPADLGAGAAIQEEVITPQGKPTPATEGKVTPGGVASPGGASEAQPEQPDAEWAVLSPTQWASTVGKAVFESRLGKKLTKKQAAAFVEAAQRGETVHKLSVKDAVTRYRNPVSAAAVDAYGITLPQGYIKQGDLYVFQPSLEQSGLGAGVATERDIETGAPKLDPKNDYFANNLASRAWRIAAGMQWDDNVGDWVHPDYSGRSRSVVEAEIAESNPPQKTDVQRVFNELAKSYGREDLIKGEKTEKQDAQDFIQVGRFVKVGYRVPVYEKGEVVGGKTNKVVGKITRIMPDGKVEVRLNQGGFKVLPPSEIEDAPTHVGNKPISPQATAAKSLVNQLNEAKSRQEAQTILESATAEQVKEAAQEMGYPATGSKKAVVSRLVAAVGSRADAKAIRQQSPQPTAAETQTPESVAVDSGAAGVVQSEPSRGSILEVEKESAKTAIESTEKSLESGYGTVVKESRDLLRVLGSKNPNAQTAIESRLRKLSVKELQDAFELVTGTPTKLTDRTQLRNNVLNALLEERIKPQIEAADKTFASAEREAEEELQRAESIARLFDKERKNPVKGQVSNADVQQAAGIVGNNGTVPSAPFTWMGNAADLLAMRNTPFARAFPGAMVAATVPNVEGVYENGMAFVFTDQVVVTDLDRRKAAEDNVSPSVAAAMRVITHENYHKGLALLPAKQQADIMAFLRSMFPADELDALARSYRQYADWRTNAAHEMALLDERLQKYIEETKTIPTDGVWKQFWDYIKAIWRKWTGKPQGEPTLQSMKDVVRIIRKALKDAHKQRPDQTKGGDRVLMSYAGEKAIENLPEERRQFMRDSLETAKAMAAAGKDSEEIRAVTGWFPGKYDGKMRWEVPDEGASMRLEEYRKERNKGHAPEEIVREFFAKKQAEDQSSALALVRGMPKDELLKFSREFTERKKQENANIYAFFVKGDNKDRGRIPMGFLLDHPALFEAYPELWWTPISFNAEDVGLEAAGQANPDGSIGLNPVISFENKDQALSTLLHEIQHLIQTKEGFAKGSSVERSAGRQGWDYYDEGQAIRDYQRTAGEIEARDVQARKDLTPEQRKAVAPYSSENIAQEDAIVLFGSGPQMSVSGTSQFVPAVNLNGRIETGTSHYEAWLKHAIRQIPSYKKDGLSDSEVKDLADRWLVDHPEAMANSMTKEGFVTDEGYLNRQDSLKKFLALGGKQRLDPGEVRDWLDSSDLEDARFSISYASETSQASSLGQQTAREMTASPRKLEAIIGVRQAYESMPKVHGNAVSLAELFDAAAKIIPNLTQVEFNSVVQGMYEDNAALLDNAETPSSIVILPNGAMMSVSSTPEQQSAAAKFKSAIIEAAKGTNKQRDYEGRPIKDRIINPLSSDVQDFVEIGQHNTVAFGAFMDAADEMLESMAKDGMSLDEILSKIQSSSFQQELGMFTVEAGQGMAMKAVMGLLLRKTANAERSAKTKAEKIQSSMLHRKAANYFTAVASTPSGQNLYALKALYNDPRTRFIFMENRALADMLKKADHGVNLRFDGAYGATQEATDTNVNASATAATKNIADQAEEAEEDDQDAIDLAAGEATLKDPEKSLYEEYKDLLREEGILARLDREEAETGAKMSISPERRSELAGLTKEERAKLREKNKQRRMEILSKLLGREEDAKTPEQKATRKKREKMAQTAQKRAQKGKEIDAKEEERAAIEMAENKASQIVYRFEELYRQGFKNPPDGMSQKKQKDSIIKAFREQVKNPTSFEVFAERLENLKVGAEVAERLFLTASRERADLIRMKGFKAEKRKVEIADKQASRLIYSTEERLRQGSKDLNTSKDGDSINKAFREQVKSPMSETAFAKRLSALNVSAEAAARLFKTAAREKFDQEAMMAYDLLSGPDAFKKMVREVNAMRPSAQVPFMKRIPWREIFRQPAKSVEEFRKNILLAIMGNDAFKDMDDAQKRQIADMFAEAWGKEREKVLNQLQKRHEDNLEAQGKREAAKALREARNQILEIANLGVFSNDELTRILGEKFGFKTSFTEAEQQKLSELAEKIQDESLSKPVRNKLAREFLATLQSGTQISIAELLSNWWVASVLSGGNTITAIALSFTNGTGIGILGTHIARAIRNMVKGDTAGAIEAITSMFKAYAKHIASFPSAANRAWNYLWTGDVSLLEASANDPFKNVRSLADIARYQIVADQVAKDPNKVKAVMGRFMQFMGRLLSALDAFNVMITKAGTTSLAIRQSGLTADQIRDAELKNDLKFYKDKIIREDPYFNGKAPTSSFDKAYLASLAEAALYKDLAEFGVKMENADYLAAEAAMTMTPTGVGGIVYNKIKALDKDITTESRERLKQAEKAWAAEKDIDTGLKLFTWRALNFLAEQGVNALGLRFARFAGNKFNQSLSYVPVLGALRVFETGNKELAGREEAFKDTIIRNQTIGFIMIIAGMKIIEAIADEPDDKKRGWFINGGWNNLTPDQKKQRLSLGEKQYTIGIGDQVFNYQNWPIGQAIAAIGELSDMIRFSPEKWKEKTTVGKFGSSLVSGMTSVLEIPALTQVGEIFGNTMAAKDPSEQTISRLSRVMAGWAGGFMPRFLKDIDYMLKPEMRKYESFYEKAASHIPIYRSYVGKEYYDILGNQIKKNAIPGSRDFDRLAQEPEYKMLGSLNARGIWLTPANAEYRMIGKGRYRRRLTQEEADRYSLETGKLYKQMIMRFGPRALQMPVEQAKDYISAKADDMRDLALLKAVR